LVSVKDRFLDPRRDGRWGYGSLASGFVGDEEFLSVSPFVFGSRQVDFDGSNRAIFGVGAQVWA
jgi:hypothetical protein